MSESYVMGRSASEAERLQRQGGYFAASTDMLLRMAGIEPGMRVLDVGCGIGDVTMQLATITGPTGTVTGVDDDADALAIARKRAAEAGLGNVRFERARIPDVRLDGRVDAVTGRLILLHLDDPVAAVRALSGLVVPGGLVTFQEINVTRARSVPPVPLVTQTVEWICAALSAGGRVPDTGERLFAIFREAGLPTPEMAVAVPAREDPAGCEYFAATLASVLPLLEKAGIATRDEIDPDTLGQRLWTRLRASGAVLILPELAGAWVRVPA